MKILSLVITTLLAVPALSASNQCLREAQRAAMATYIAGNQGIQGSSPSSSAVLLEETNGQQTYQVDVYDQNDEGDTWVRIFDVETKLRAGRCVTLHTQSMPLKDLEADLKHELRELVDSHSVHDLTSTQKISLGFERAYDILKTPITSKNYVTIFIGQRKDSLAYKEFLIGMNQHVQDVRDAFQAYGLIGYQVLITTKYEFAYQVWESKAAADAAFDSAAAKPILEQAGDLLETLVFKQTTDLQ